MRDVAPILSLVKVVKKINKKIEEVMSYALKYLSNPQSDLGTQLAGNRPCLGCAAQDEVPQTNFSDYPTC